MNCPRTHEITQIVFASKKTALNEKALHHRKDLHLHKLRTELPCLRNLRGSLLQVEFVFNDGPPKLLAYLEESSQLALRFHRSNALGHDLFRQDVENVLAQQGGVLERYQEALRSHEDPQMHPEMVEIRRQIWKSRRDGYIHVSSSPQGERMPTDNVPSTLPQSARAVGQGFVQALTRRSVKIALTADLMTPVSSVPLYRADSTLEVHLRKGELGRESFLQLAGAHYDKTQLELDVGVEFRWVDGSPHRTTLYGYRIDTGPGTA